VCLHLQKLVQALTLLSCVLAVRRSHLPTNTEYFNVLLVFTQSLHSVLNEVTPACLQMLSDLLSVFVNYKSHTDELQAPHSSPNTIQIIKLFIRWAGHVACMEERRAAYRVLVEKPEENKLL
jgi:hypothetical protein